MSQPDFFRMLNTRGVDTLTDWLPSNPSIPSVFLANTFGNTLRIMLAAPFTSA
jgi:hypothetical protein